MQLKKVGNIYQSGGMKKVGNIRDLQQGKPSPVPQSTSQTPSNQSGGAWNWTMKQLVKPVSSASNALEDLGKTMAYPIANAIKPGSFQDYAKKVGINPVQHQKDVWGGDNQRTYSTIMNEIASKEQNSVLSGLQRATGYAGDFTLDPLNKVKIASLTESGLKAAKEGKVALSMAEQANKGQRALLQLGNYNVLPSVGNRILASTTSANDALRGTAIGAKLANVGAAVSGKIRPAGVSRDEFKILTDAKTAARNTIGYTTDKAIQFAKGMAQELDKLGATPEQRAMLLHGIEKGDESLVHPGLQNLWKAGVDFKSANENQWKSLGGSVLENYGLAHVATPEVANAARKDALRQGGGFKLYSPNTPQDIHRKWAKVDGEIMNLNDSGVVFDKKTGLYLKNVGQETANGGFKGKWEPVNVEQASAHEINQAMAGQGKAPLFQEDLPLVAAKMGISTGRKQAGVDFMNATKDLKSEEAKALANETYQKMTNVESLNQAIKSFDAIQNIWKAQALIAPSYHIRNIAGNLWNNFLADVKTPAYAIAGNLQLAMRRGKLTEVQVKLIDEMERHGVIGTGQYTGDIAQAISSEVGKNALNPFSQRFVGYRANRALGSSLEDNAKIAHYLSKRAEGYGAKEAAESVKKYLFDYGDLTFAEKNLLKRVLPFYTWTSKNIPLQVQQFIENPGKFSKISTTKKDIEQGVSQPNEQYMSDSLRESSPIRIGQDANGNVQYLSLGNYLPAVSAMGAITNPTQNAIGMATPIAKLPLETVLNKSSFFQDTLGNYDNLTKFPGQKTSYLGVDIDPRLANILRTIRITNELDKLNPKGIFGEKNSPSVWKGILENASNQRGGKFTPEISQEDRIKNYIFGKLTQQYNPKDAKYFYDRDTQTRMDEYDAEIKRAVKNHQDDLAKRLIAERQKFKQSRSPQKLSPFYTK